MAFAARLMTAALVAAATGVDAQTAAGAGHARPLQVRLDAGRIRVSTSGSLILDGPSLERLHNGSPVVFAVQAAVLNTSRGAVLARSAGRFAVSFDIWEERFAVTRLGNPRKSASHLAVAEAEAWCLENLVLSHAGISPDTAFWVRLDVQTEEADERPAPGEEAGITLARLVDLFSRPRREGEARRQAEAGPLRLRDLR